MIFRRKTIKKLTILRSSSGVRALLNPYPYKNSKLFNEDLKSYNFLKSILIERENLFDYIRSNNMGSIAIDDLDLKERIMDKSKNFSTDGKYIYFHTDEQFMDIYTKKSIHNLSEQNEKGLKNKLDNLYPEGKKELRDLFATAARNLRDSNHNQDHNNKVQSTYYYRFIHLFLKNFDVELNTLGNALGTTLFHKILEQYAQKKKRDDFFHRQQNLIEDKKLPEIFSYESFTNLTSQEVYISLGKTFFYTYLTNLPQFQKMVDWKLTFNKAIMGLPVPYFEDFKKLFMYFLKKKKGIYEEDKSFKIENNLVFYEFQSFEALFPKIWEQTILFFGLDMLNHYRIWSYQSLKRQEFLNEFICLIDNIRVIKVQMNAELDDFYLQLGSLICDEVILLAPDKINRRLTTFKDEINKFNLLYVEPKLLRIIKKETCTQYAPALIEKNFIDSMQSPVTLIKKMNPNTSINLEYHSETIADSPSGDTGFLTESVYNKDLGIHYRKVSVDFFMLESIFDIIPRSNDEEEIKKQKMDKFKQIYDLNWGLDVRDDFLKDMEIFACDPDTTEEFEAALTKKVKNCSRTKRTMQKIKQHKWIFLNLIREAVYYICFRYCILNTKVDFRGREYTQHEFFNLQSDQFIKGFIKLYESPVDPDPESHLPPFYNQILKVFTNKEVKQKLIREIPDRKTFTDKRNEFILQSLFSYLDSDSISFEAFNAILKEKNTDFHFWYLFAVKHVKKKKYLLVFVSYVRLFLKDESIYEFCNPYSMDATTSGYQMLALLLNSKSLALKTNLAGTTRSDIYQIVLDTFLSQINEGKEYLYKYLKATFPSQVASLGPSEELISEKFLTLLPSDFQSLIIGKDVMETNDEFAMKTNNLISSYIPDIFEEENVENIDWFILSSKANIANFGEQNKKKIKIFFLLKHIFTFFLMIERHPVIIKYKILYKRGLFKGVVLIVNYGGTRMGMSDQLDNFFEEMRIEKGFALPWKDKSALKNYILCFFENYKNKFMPETNIINKILDKIARKSMDKNEFTSVKLITEDLSILFAPYKINNRKRVITPNILTRSKLKFFTAKYTDKTKTSLVIDGRKLKQSFAPNFIHSMDAAIQHDVIKKFYFFSKSLAYNSTFSIYTNHDNFSIGRFLAPYLPYIVRDAYLSLKRSKYFYKIQDLTPSMKYFIEKHIYQPGHPNYLTDEDILTNEFFLTV